MTDEELAAIEALCAAHPGPYDIARSTEDDGVEYGASWELPIGMEIDGRTISFQDGEVYPNELAPLHAMTEKANAVPALLADYRAGAAERDAIRTAIEALRVWRDNDDTCMPIEEVCNLLDTYDEKLP